MNFSSVNFFVSWMALISRNMCFKLKLFPPHITNIRECIFWIFIYLTTGYGDTVFYLLTLTLTLTQCYNLNSHMIRRLISFREYLGNLNAVWQGLQDAYFGGDLSQLKLIESLASIWNCKTMICRSQHGQDHTVSCTLCGLEPSWSVDASLGKNVCCKPKYFAMALFRNLFLLSMHSVRLNW